MLATDWPWSLAERQRTVRLLERLASTIRQYKSWGSAAVDFGSAWLTITTASRANSAEPQKIRDALAQTKGFEGAAGDITINADRDADKPAVFKQVKGGKFAFLSTVKP